MNEKSRMIGRPLDFERPVSITLAATYRDGGTETLTWNYATLGPFDVSHGRFCIDWSFRISGEGMPDHEITPPNGSPPAG